ncbi:hypothetical protein KQH29_00480 [bacterium]|nr:hypothetical protein [bacterium]
MKTMTLAALLLAVIGGATLAMAAQDTSTSPALNQTQVAGGNDTFWPNSSESQAGIEPHYVSGWDGCDHWYGRFIPGHRDRCYRSHCGSSDHDDNRGDNKHRGRDAHWGCC